MRTLRSTALAAMEAPVARWIQVVSILCALAAVILHCYNNGLVVAVVLLAVPAACVGALYVLAYITMAVWCLRVSLSGQLRTTAQ
jgi:hypothetical protein